MEAAEGDAKWTKYDLSGGGQWNNVHRALQAIHMKKGQDFQKSI